MPFIWHPVLFMYDQAVGMVVNTPLGSTSVLRSLRMSSGITGVCGISPSGLSELEAGELLGEVKGPPGEQRLDAHALGHRFEIKLTALGDYR